MLTRILSAAIAIAVLTAGPSMAADKTNVLIGKTEIEAIQCLGAPSFMKDYGGQTLVVWESGRVVGDSDLIITRTCKITAIFEGERIVSAESKGNHFMGVLRECNRVLKGC